jgi:hypothetical protein
MTHFSPEEWVDFARHKVTPECEAEMQGHLATGCADCEHTLEVWLGVLEVARTMHHPPQGGVRIAKALYPVVPPATSRFLSVEVARLVFPKYQDLAGEGVRVFQTPFSLPTGGSAVGRSGRIPA